MNIRALLQQITGSKRSEEATSCPGEATILAYTDGRFSSGKQARLEAHLAKCDECRELLAFVIKEPVNTTSAEMVSDEEVKQQTASVLAYIKRDEATRSRANRRASNRLAPNPGMGFAFPKLASVALIVCAVGTGVVFWRIADGPNEAALFALQRAMKDERRNQALISGDIKASRYSPLRGAEETDDLNYDLAANKLSFAQSETAPPASRLLLARILLAKAEPEDTVKALSILSQLESAGTQTAELFNDRGVAELQMGRYEAAISYFTKATQKSPEDSRFLFNKALAEQRAGRQAEARQDWNHFISIASDEQLKDEARDQLGLLR